MAVLFKGIGLVLIPAKGRYIRFVNGEYSTNDADEIAVLSKRYEHDSIAGPIDEGQIAEAPKKRGRPSRGADE